MPASTEPFNSRDYGLSKEIDDFGFDGLYDSHKTNGGGFGGGEVFLYEPENYTSGWGDSEVLDITPFESAIPERKMKSSDSVNQKRMKILTAIGLISGGLYTVLRSVARRS